MLNQLNLSSKPTSVNNMNPLSTLDQVYGYILCSNRLLPLELMIFNSTLPSYLKTCINLPHYCIPAPKMHFLKILSFLKWCLHNFMK